MDNLAKFIIEKTVDGSIGVETSTDMLHLLKKEKKHGHKDIAVIGVSFHFPQADNMEQLWDVLANGKNCITDFPEERYQDACDMLNRTNMQEENPTFSKGGYLNSIDKFDHNFFHLSWSEAKLMDPNQRIFLETAWSAFEDAGYGGDKIKGSNTGTYVGYGNSMDCAYSQFIIGQDPSTTAASMPGNITPIIASRISYLLDLKGPSLVVDTACSSSFTALHLACKALEDEECDMALAGGINLSLLPLWKKFIQVGIESSHADLRAFDDSSDGVCWSEGTGAVILKPLDKAVADADNIYAVIKGSAMNQDGNSAGISAPNEKAQEEVLIKAWENAQVEAESISYIEAHGTGTKLGDPIEVEAITSAFRKFTDKKQFCGLGSVKSNIGHLNCASGMASLMKGIASLQQKQIPPSIHFKMPNRHIGFTSSPVYINDTLRNWESGKYPRRCGISSFGFSGTNIHFVLEEAPADKAEERTADKGVQIFKLSAGKKNVLYELIHEYQKFCQEHTEIPLERICYTADTGRGDYEHRLLVMAKDTAELARKLEITGFNDLEEVLSEGVYYGRHKFVNEDKKHREAYELTEFEKMQKSEEADKLTEHIADENGKLDREQLEKLAELYILGADINWEALYQNRKIKKVSLPVYPFERVRCWLDFDEMKQVTSKGADTDENIPLHPLANKGMVSSYDCDIFRTQVSMEQNWFLSDHVIEDVCVAPGTVWIEALRYVGEQYLGKGNLKLKVLFIQPVKVLKSETKEVQIIVKKNQGQYAFQVVSRDSQNPENWLMHAQGSFTSIEEKHPDRLQVDIADLKNRLDTKKEVKQEDYQGGAITFGPRWFNLKEVCGKNNEFLGYLELQDAFQDDLKEYKMHPAMLDIATSFCNTDGFYLPMEYKNLEIYDDMPKKVYSYVCKKENANDLETQNFDVTLCDEFGKVFAKADGFVMKKVRENEMKSFHQNQNGYFELRWRKDTEPMNCQPLKAGAIVIFQDGKQYGSELASQFKRLDRKVILVSQSDAFQKLDETHYTVDNQEESYQELFRELKEESIRYVFYLAAIQEKPSKWNYETFEQCQQRGIISLFYMVRSIMNNKYKDDLDLILAGEQVYSVTDSDTAAGTFHAAMFGLGKVITAEYSNIRCKAVDIEEGTTWEEILNEARNETHYYQSAYRNHVRYVEEFSEFDLEKSGQAEAEIKENGVYVITGGTGGIGLEVSKWLAGKTKVYLVLINRSQFPEREEWDTLLAQNSEKYSKGITAIREIEDMGSTVTCMCANIGEKEDTERVIREIHNRFGRIQGVFHAAGVPGTKLLYNKTEAEFKEILTPKVEGTWLLDQLTSEDNPDFMVLFSSINSLMGVSGQGDYTAANLFMDTYAKSGVSCCKRVIAINWPAWKETGMAVRFGVNHDEGIFKSIGSKEAIQALEELLGHQVKHVLTGQLNADSEQVKKIKHFPFHMEEKIRRLLNKGAANKTVSAQKADIQVRIKGNSKNQYSDTEQKLAKIWGKVLGTEEIDIYDSFSSVGGDSIQAVNLLKELENEFPNMFDITDIFTYSTIKKMSDYIREQTGDSTNSDAIEIAVEEETETEESMDDLLKKLESGELSVDEVENLMK